MDDRDIGVAEANDIKDLTDTVSGIKDALGLVLVTLVANRVVEGEELATLFLRHGVAARHGPGARRVLEDCAHTLRAAAAELEMQEEDQPP